MSELAIDLRSAYGPPRDQGRRQTCLAFATSDAHGLVHSSPALELSAEYAHFHASHRMPRFSPSSGTSPAAMFSAIDIEGQPLEDEWPYLGTVPVDLTQYSPPVVVASLFRHRAELLTDLQIGEQALRSKRPLIIGLNLTASFFALKNLERLEADVDLNSMGRHAVLAVGLQERVAGNAYLIRNSWGTRWGDNGYALLSVDYIKPRLLFVGAFNA